jgi:hypothetical protein
MADRLDIAKLKLEKGLLSNKGVPSQDLATGLQGLFSGIDADVQAKRETRQKFKEESASDIRDLRSLRAEAEAAGATKDKSSSGKSIKLGDIPTSTTLANWTLSQLDGFIQDSYDKQEIVTSGLGGQFAVRDYNIFKNNQKQTWQAVKGRADAAAAELEETIRRAEGYTNDEGVFIPPVAGAGEAAFQRYQSIIGDLNNTRVRSGEDGMGVVEVYETVFDKDKGVQKRVLDENDNPVINKNISGTSVMALLNKQNSRWQKTDVISSVEKAFGKDVIASYQVSTNHPGYIKGSSREDNIRRNPSFTRYQDTFIAKTLPNNRAVSSALTDNYGGEFYQLDPNQTASEMVDGVKIDMNETISVSVLTGYDSNGKPLYADVEAPKYIGSKVEGDSIVVETTEDHKKAASGIVRATIDGQLGVKVVEGEPIKQWDPYRDSKVKSQDRKNKGVDLFKQITRSYDGEDDDVKNAVENLMISSNFKFNETISEKDGDTVVSQTYQVDKGDGVFKSFKVSLQTKNPKWDEDKQKGLKEGDAGYVPKYIPISKAEYEDKMYELFKGRDDNSSVSEARKNYSSNKANKYSPTGTFNPKGDRDMSVKTTENVEITGIDDISVNTQIGDKSAIDTITGSKAYQNIKDNWSEAGVKNETVQLQGLQGSIQSTFDSLKAEQKGNQGAGVEVKYDADTAEFYFVGPNGEETEKVSVAVDNTELDGQVTKILADGISKFLAGRAEGTRKKTTVGGNEVFVDAQGVEVDEFGVPIKK